jgi:hypothetical protein
LRSKPFFRAVLFYLTEVVNGIEMMYMTHVMLEFDDFFTGKRITLPAIQEPPSFSTESNPADVTPLMEEFSLPATASAGETSRIITLV